MATAANVRVLCRAMVAHKGRRTLIGYSTKKFGRLVPREHRLPIPLWRCGRDTARRMLAREVY